MISLSKGGDPAERNPNVGPIGETLSYVQRQVWVQEIAVWVQETASVAYGWVGAVMEGFLVQWKWKLVIFRSSCCCRRVVVGDSISRVRVGRGSNGRFPRSVEVEVDVGDIP